MANMRRKTTVEIETDDATIELVGKRGGISIEISTPDTGYGMQESPGDSASTLLSEKSYHELTQALAEAGKAAGWGG